MSEADKKGYWVAQVEIADLEGVLPQHRARRALADERDLSSVTGPREAQQAVIALIRHQGPRDP